jgi:hypothetical protein
MIYTQRIFHVNRKDLTEFVRLSEERIWPYVEERGVRPVALWHQVLGGKDRVYLLTRYDSLSHWEQARFHENQLDLKVDGAAERAKLTRDFDVSVWKPLSERPLLDQAPESTPGMYILNGFKLLPKMEDRFASVLEKDIWSWKAHTPGIRPIGIWLSILASDIRVYEMVRYDGMEQWEAEADAEAEPSDTALKPVWQKAIKAAKELETIIVDKSVAALRPITERRP